MHDFESLAYPVTVYHSHFLYINMLSLCRKLTVLLAQDVINCTFIESMFEDADNMDTCSPSAEMGTHIQSHLCPWIPL
jgi:hypothetical protein